MSCISTFLTNSHALDLADNSPPEIVLSLSVCLFFRLSNTQGINIQIIGGNTILMIANVTEEDYGNYTCVASNRLGAQSASVFLYSECRVCGLILYKLEVYPNEIGSLEVHCLYNFKTYETYRH